MEIIILWLIWLLRKICGPSVVCLTAAVFSTFYHLSVFIFTFFIFAILLGFEKANEVIQKY